MAGNQKKRQQMMLIQNCLVAPTVMNTANGGNNKAIC